MAQRMDDTDWLEVTIARKWNEAVNTVGFELVASDGGFLPTFNAGSHVDVLTPGDLLRPYSLCNSPTERHRYVIAVLRESCGRGGSIALHDRARQGDRLRISVPRNEFSLRTGVIYSVLLAGGIGVTPLLGMADTLWRQGAGFEMHYGARNADRAAFLDTLRASSYATRVKYHWSEEQGWIDFVRILRRVPVLSQLYVCGPVGFVDCAVAAATTAGWPVERIQLESFEPGLNFKAY